MASRSNLGGQGGVEMKISGDTSPLIQDVAEAKVEVEKLADGTSKLATETTKAGAAAKEAFGEGGQTQGGLKGLNKTLGDTVGQVQGLIGKFAIVTGVATGMFALGRAIREGVIDVLRDGATAAKDFAESLQSVAPKDLVADFDKKIKEVEGKLDDAYADVEQTRGNALVISNALAKRRVKQFEDELTQLKNDAQKQREAVEAGTESAKKIADAKALAEQFEAEVVAMIKRNAAAKELDQKRADENNKIEEERRRERVKAIGEEMKAQEDLADKVAEYQRRQREAAERTKQAWVDSLTAIKAASNDVFGNNRAVSDAGMAGVVSSIGTRSAANNRVVFEGGN
jgi:DNA repair exonuclease SbcCD ATPase subunit